MNNFWLLNALNSNREGHLVAAGLVGIQPIMLAMMGGWIFPPYILMRLGLFIVAWELIATMDMDHPSRKIRGAWYRRVWVLWWLPVRGINPRSRCAILRGLKHRSRWTHSLLLGTPFRLLYASIPAISFWLLRSDSWLIPAIFRPDTNLAIFFHAAHYELANLIWILGNVRSVQENLICWVAAAFIADATHLFKDKYFKRPLTVLFGVK